MAQKIRWGVLGSGGIARRRTIPEGILRSPRAVLAAVFDVNSKLNGEVAKATGARAAASEKDLIHSDLDAVYVATPADCHVRQVLECAKAGKHVLCEKPLGLTVNDAAAMIAACKRAKISLGTAFMMRFQTQHLAAMRLIQEGRLGKPAYARAQLSCWYPPIRGAWRQDPARGGGGALMDMGGHCIDLLEMFFGPAKRVACSTGNLVHRYRAEDGAVALIEFTNGAMGTVDTFFCIPDASSFNVLELYGSKGGIVARNTIGQAPKGEMTAFLQSDKDKGKYDAKQARQSADGHKINPAPRNMYEAEITEFSAALIEKRAPLNSAEAGMHSQKVLAACYRSAQTGRWEKV